MKKKIFTKQNLVQRFFVLMAMFLFTGTVFSQTNVPAGDVEGTWTAANSPYRIQGNVTIPSTSNLVIEPGVKVEFEGAYEIYVQGQIFAIGEKDKMIEFTIAENATDTAW